MVNKEKDRLHAILFASFLVLLLSISPISALNAKIGNGKVVLYAKVGDVIEKSVKVINDNNVSVNIELIPDGDLKDYFKFKNANFTLEPNEETDAEYSLKVAKEGRSDSYINVKFTPTEGKNGIVLPASIIIFANGTSDDGGWFDWLSPKNDTDTNSTGNDDDNDDKTSISPIALVLAITAIVFVILLILLYVYNSKNKKKLSIKETSERKNKGDVNLNQKKKAN